MKDINEYLSKLNPQQREAVETLEGPVLVIAGPGTGKTQVLALRIANIIQKTDASASNILCLTFTESGVAAMRDRLIKMIGREAYQVRIHTFHSFCNEIIQAFPEKFAFAKDLIQLDDLNKLKIIQKLITELDSERKYHLRPLHDPYYYQNDILNAIQTLKREGITPERMNEVSYKIAKELEDNTELNKKTGKPTGKWLSNFKNAQKIIELAEIYERYNKKLLESGFYDYEDMILFVIQKLNEDDELLAYYQEKFLYILVDEYQDTNGSQNELLKILGSFDPSPNIFAVGDDDQAIYRFQGANVENLLFFERQFENVKVIPITTNYRSSQLILNLASSSIVSNKARLVNLIKGLTKDLKSGVPLPSNKAVVYELSSSEIENKYIVSKIKELHSNGVNYSDIAIFYRKHSDVEDIVESLLKAQIPIRLAAGRNSLDTLIVRQFLNLLKVIQHADKEREFLLFQVLFYDFFKFNRIDVFRLTNYAYHRKLPLVNVMLNAEQMQEAGIENPEVFIKFGESIINWKSLSSNLSLTQFIERVAMESGFISSIFTVDADVENINSVSSFFNYVRVVNKLNKNISLGEFLEDINLLERNKIIISERELEIQKDGVNLMTAHKSKGLEFRYVFITKFYEGNWGGRRSRETIKLPFSQLYQSNSNDNQSLAIGDAIDFDLEDERRLFFVALTRAKEQLYISYAKNYPSGNSTKEVAASQFLFELDRNLIDMGDCSDYEKDDIEYTKTILSPAKLSNPYSPSEREFLNNIVKNFKVSASALNDYINCPLKFKYNWLFRIPKSIDRSLIMGSAIHYALESFFRNYKKGIINDSTFLVNSYKAYLEKELLGPDDFNQTLVEGTKLLTDYYNFYDGKFSIPAEVEYGFFDKEILLEAYDMDPIYLTGKLDKIEWINTNRSQNSIDDLSVRLIDYKVMTPKSINEIKGLTKKEDPSIFRQLVFYKLLAELDPNFKPNISSPKYQVEEVGIDFIKPNQRGAFKRETFEITKDDVEDLKKLIVEVSSKIRNHEFGGSEEYPLCGECEFCKINFV